MQCIIGRKVYAKALKPICEKKKLRVVDAVEYCIRETAKALGVGKVVEVTAEALAEGLAAAKAKIDEIVAWGVCDFASSDESQKILDILKNQAPDADYFGELLPRAVEAVAETVVKVQDLHDELLAEEDRKAQELADDIEAKAVALDRLVADKNAAVERLGELGADNASLVASNELLNNNLAAANAAHASVVEENASISEEKVSLTEVNEGLVGRITKAEKALEALSVKAEKLEADVKKAKAAKK